MPPVEGVMVTDVVAAQPRTLPNIILDKLLPGSGSRPDLVSEGVGVLDIKSVYDFDGVDTATPNIATVADPAHTAAAQRPARFIRIEKAVSHAGRDVSSISTTPRSARATSCARSWATRRSSRMARCSIKVPANVAFQISVLDANGRRIRPIHAVWLQVRPGEVADLQRLPHRRPTQQNPHLARPRGPVHGRLRRRGRTGAAVPACQPRRFMSPDAGETMAQSARAAASCATDTPEVLQTDTRA